MSSLSPRLQVRVQQKQILTPGLVQMVSLLQLNRLELKEMISAEIAQNPVLEESADGAEELTPEELQPLLEAERTAEPADQSILEVTGGPAETDDQEADASGDRRRGVGRSGAGDGRSVAAPETPEVTETKPPIRSMRSISATISTNIWTPASRARRRRTSKSLRSRRFLSSPVTLSDHLHSQLALVALTEKVRDAAEEVIGNLDENGYLTLTPEEIAASGGHSPADVAEALRVVHTLDPAGVGAADVRECLLLQLESRNGKGGVAWQIVADHLKLVEMRQFKEIARLLHRPMEHIQIAIDVIRHLDPRPGLRYSGPGARQVEPDVYISKDGDDYLISAQRRGSPAAALEPAVPAHAGSRPGAESATFAITCGTATLPRSSS